MRESVRQDCRHAWQGYKQYAWGADALKPLSKGKHDWYQHSLLMTPVDAYDTLALLGLREEAAEAKALIFERLRFDYDMDVQNFEVSIRLLGGLLSAYEIDGDKRFLQLAKDLGDRLAKAFDSPTGMPYRYVNLVTGKTREAVSNPAEIGTYIIEYGILSRHTGDPKYYRMARKAMLALHGCRSSLGLTGSKINVETGKWTNTDSHISGGIDSYYEYALKAGLLFHDQEMMDIWKTSVAAVNKYLADDAPPGLWYGHADMNTGKRSGQKYGALDAFFAATLALDGDLGRAKLLQEANYRLWTLAGVEPERMDYATMKITDPAYPLRPENLESVYCLYHFTHDERYLQMGWTMVQSLEKYCRNDVGFCALESVETKEKSDEMESFFFAETLKYAFLIFDDGKALDFEKIIFNTEAHPYRREGKSVTP